MKKNVTDSSMIGARNWNTSCKQSCIAAIGQAATRKHVDSKRTSYRSVAWLQGTGGAVEAWGGVFSWSVTHSEQAHCWLGAFFRHNHLTQVCTQQRVIYILTTLNTSSVIRIHRVVRLLPLFKIKDCGYFGGSTWQLPQLNAVLVLLGVFGY